NSAPSPTAAQNTAPPRPRGGGRHADSPPCPPLHSAIPAAAGGPSPPTGPPVPRPAPPRSSAHSAAPAPPPDSTALAPPPAAGSNTATALTPPLPMPILPLSETCPTSGMLPTHSAWLGCYQMD